MRRSLGLSFALAGLLTLPACGGSSPMGLATSGSGNVVLTISSGVTPTISWTGGNARRLSVTQSTGGGVFWDLEPLNTTGFVAPVTFGVVPSGARQTSTSVNLTAGTDYRVSVTLVDGTEGSKVFRP